MGVVIGTSTVTRFSYIEYQLLMLCLAAVICMGFLVIELTLRRFQVLPLLFPGMFSIRERRFYFFDYEVRNVSLGQKLRWEAKMLTRMAITVVLSYLWQSCVLETTQVVGREFPTQQCDQRSDCFASELHFQTLVNRQYAAVDCAHPVEAFEEAVVVSCIRFVRPSAVNWMMHMAIAHSVTLLNLKTYEIMTYIAGNSKWVQRVIAGLMVLCVFLFFGLFFSGILSEFATSWLSFVMSLSIPTFLYSVYQSSKVLNSLKQEEIKRVSASIDAHLNSALSDFEILSRGAGDAEIEALAGDGAGGEVDAAELSRGSDSDRTPRGSRYMSKASNLLSRVWQVRSKSNLSNRSGREPSADEAPAAATPSPRENVEDAEGA